MANIAVICEGVSEFKIIESIVARYCGSEHLLNPIQPKIDLEKDVQSENGGWSRVLAHCNDEIFNEIFQYNEYLILQIDTDASPIDPYSVAHINSRGGAKTHKRLHAEIKLRLLNDLSHELKKRYLSRIIFAICHEEIECWFLPIYYADQRACKTNNCIKTLNIALSKKNLYGVPESGKNSPQARKAYKSILKNLRKKEEIKRVASYSYGFASFIEGLNLVCE